MFRLAAHEVRFIPKQPPVCLFQCVCVGGGDVRGGGGNHHTATSLFWGKMANLYVDSLTCKMNFFHLSLLVIYNYILNIIEFLYLSVAAS